MTFRCLLGALATAGVADAPCLSPRYPGNVPAFIAAVRKGIIVSKFALALALALMTAGTAQAKLIELVPETGGTAPPVAHVARPDHAARPQLAALPLTVSELPEPEVFAMMLVGLILLGYRARRDSSEKFK